MKDQKANTLLKEKLRRCASKHRVAHPFMQRGKCGMQCRIRFAPAHRPKPDHSTQPRFVRCGYTLSTAGMIRRGSVGYRLRMSNQDKEDRNTCEAFAGEAETCV